jgi:hypothetical protein
MHGYKYRYYTKPSYGEDYRYTYATDVSTDIYRLIRLISYKYYITNTSMLVSGSGSGSGSGKAAHKRDTETDRQLR